MKNRKIILSFYILLFVTSFDILFDENFQYPTVYSILKVFDELYIGFFFIIAIFKNKQREFKTLVFIFILFLIGTVGNIKNHSAFTTVILGAYSTIKPMLLYWSLAQYNFVWKDFHKLRKLICAIFPLVVVSYILDLAIPSFRSDIGIISQAVEIRMGLRSIGGFFNRFTVATLYALLFYIFYKFYDKDKVSKIKIFFSDFMFLASFKIKDILGFMLARSFYLFKRFKAKYIVIIASIIYLLFLLYANLMPEHYNEYFNSGEDSNVARVVLSYTSIRILKDYFPFGVGWGLFASPTSQQIQSPIYARYGIDDIYGLSYQNDNGVFMSDTFWPMILGETGFLGTIVYLYILYLVFWPFVSNFFIDNRDRKYIMPAFLFIAFLGFSVGKPVFTGPPHSLVLWGFAGLFYSLKNTTYEVK